MVDMYSVGCVVDYFCCCRVYKEIIYVWFVGFDYDIIKLFVVGIFDDWVIGMVVYDFGLYVI